MNRKERKELTDKIRWFLKARPELSLNAIERKAKTYQSLLSDIKEGKVLSTSEEYLSNIIAALRPYGFEPSKKYFPKGLEI